MKHSSQYGFDYAILAKEMGQKELTSLFYVFDHFGTKEIKKALEEKRLKGDSYYNESWKCGCFVGVNIKDYIKAFHWAQTHQLARPAEFWLYRRGDLGLVTKAIQLWESRLKSA